MTVTSSGLAFFSENNLKALAERLGHDRVRTILNEIQTSSRARQTASITSMSQMHDLDMNTVLDGYSTKSIAAYVQCE